MALREFGSGARDLLSNANEETSFNASKFRRRPAALAIAMDHPSDDLKTRTVGKSSNSQ